MTDPFPTPTPKKRRRLTPHQRFREHSERMMRGALQSLRSLQDLGGERYACTAEERDKVVATLELAVARVKNALEPKPEDPAEPTFSWD